VSRDEWCRLWTTPNDSCDSWQSTYMSFMFYLLDTSGKFVRGASSFFEFKLKSNFVMQLKE
jgi:hypothetical protein